MSTTIFHSTVAIPMKTMTANQYSAFAHMRMRIIWKKAKVFLEIFDNAYQKLSQSSIKNTKLHLQDFPRNTSHQHAHQHGHQPTAKHKHLLLPNGIVRYYRGNKYFTYTFAILTELTYYYCLISFVRAKNTDYYGHFYFFNNETVNLKNHVKTL